VEKKSRRSYNVGGSIDCEVAGLNAQRTLREIAAEIEADWRVINNRPAKKALDYMKTMETIEAPFATDPHGHAVVGSFLNHALGWKGEVARRVKKELRMCRYPRA
jgi:hypothetical protein